MSALLDEKLLIQKEHYKMPMLNTNMKEICPPNYKTALNSMPLVLTFKFKSTFLRKC